MADSSCSGSTPFKGLVDHGTQDRSLYRDRFSSAPSPQQGFRSTTQAFSAPAQTGFGEFLDPNGSGQVSLNTPQTYNSPISSLPRTFHTPAAPDSRILSPNPYQSASQIPTTSQQNGSITSPPRASSWAQDFATFSRAPPGAGSQITGFPSSQYRAPAAGLTQNIMGSHSRPWLFGPQGGSAAVINHGVTSTEAEFDLEMNQWMAAHGDGQMEDLDTVMEQLARELEQEQQTEDAMQSSKGTIGDFVDTATVSTSDVSGQDEAQRIQAFAATTSTTQQVSGTTSVLETGAINVPIKASFSDHMPDLEHLGLDKANEASAEQGQSASEISEAARQILDSVQHEQGDKWKNSRFLSLMKDFRDGHKDIINNEILETSVGGERMGGN